MPESPLPLDLADTCRRLYQEIRDLSTSSASALANVGITVRSNVINHAVTMLDPTFGDLGAASYFVHTEYRTLFGPPEKTGLDLFAIEDTDTDLTTNRCALAVVAVATARCIQLPDELINPYDPDPTAKKHIQNFAYMHHTVPPPIDAIEDYHAATLDEITTGNRQKTVIRRNTDSRVDTSGKEAFGELGKQASRLLFTIVDDIDSQVEGNETDSLIDAAVRVGMGDIETVSTALYIASQAKETPVVGIFNNKLVFASPSQTPQEIVSDWRNSRPIR